MPLLHGAEHPKRLIQPGVRPDTEVLVLRFTGEVFKDYEDYLRALELYRQRTWTCAVTGRSGLSYEEALTSESLSGGLLSQPLPESLEPAVCRLVHHATSRLPELLLAIATALQSGFQPGERVLGSHDGRTLPCRVVRAQPRGGSDGGAEHDAFGASPAAYEVEWIIDGMQGSVFTQLPASALEREQALPSKSALRATLQQLADCEPVDGVPGVPCVWRVRPQWRQKHGLPQELPPDLAERLQQRKAASISPAAAAAALLREHGSPEAARFAASPGPGSLAVAELAAAAEEAAEAPQPVEPLEETEARLPPGSVKHGIFQVLRDAGPGGAGLQELIDGLAERGVKTWPEARIAKSSIASTCGHDPAFVRIGAGVFALRAVTHLPEVAPSRNATLGQKAAAAIAAVQAKEAAVLQQLEDDTAGGGAPGANTLKCPRCHRGHHPEGSPLVLCDGCPRAYHLACMRGVGWGDLPAGEWHCPRCAERRGAALRKLAEFEARKHEALERVAVAEREKDERSRRRLAEREQREAAKTAEREERDRQKAAAVAERDAHRAAARRAARFPLDDWQALEEEQAQLRRAEARAAEVATAAAHPHYGDDGAAAAAAHKAAEAAAMLRRRVDGPQKLQAAAAPEDHWGPLADALAVVEFVRVFGSVVGVQPVSLQALRAAARWPLDNDVLPELYLSLLQCLLREQVSVTIGVFKSQCRRWARCVSATTWPEVLRRYLLFSRALVAVPLAAVQGLKPHQLDDQAVAVLAAKSLSQQPWHRLSGPLHLRLLAALAADATNCGQLRILLAEREAILASLTIDRQKEVIEGKKRAKEEDALRREEERALRDSLGGGAPSGLPADLLVYRGDPEDQEALEQWHEQREQAQADGHRLPSDSAAQAEVRLADLAEERRGVQRAREAAEVAHVAAVDAATIRGEVLGCDRADRHYWWFPSEAPGAIFIEDGAGPVGIVTSVAQLDDLRARLNTRGCREKALAAALERRADELAAALDGGDGAPAMDLASLPRASAADGPELPSVEELCSSGDTAAVQGAASALEDTLSQLYDTFQSTLPGSMKDWRRRCRGADSAPELRDMLLEAEQLAAPLMDGLPRNAHDEAMDAWPADPAALLPPLPRDLAAEAAAANETRQQRRLQRHRERLKELREEAAAKAEGRPWPPPGGTPKRTTHDDDSASDDDEKGGRNPNGSAPPPPLPSPAKRSGTPWFELPPLPEMDISDAEKMELKAAENGGERERRRHPPRCSLWRSARERAVWLHDVRASAAAGDVHALAYAAAVYCDRCQPLVVKAQKLATGEIKPPRASARIQEAGFPAASAAQPAAHAHSNGGGGGGAPNGVAPGARRQRTSYTSLSASANASGAGAGGGGGGGRIRVRLGGAAVGRAERPATPDTRAGTPDTVSDLPSWGAPGDRSSSPADDVTAATSGAPRPPKPVTKLKLHFGGAGGARVSRAGTDSPGLKAESGPADSPATASPAQSQEPPQQRQAPPQQPPPWYARDDDGEGALFPRVPTKKRRHKGPSGA